MNIRDLEYFNTLVEVKNFSLVAQKFDVSQPTITMAIRRLEKEYQTKFFIRNQAHKELIVTEAGKQFYEHSKTVISELELASKDIEHAKQHKILFGLPPIIGTYYFPLATPQLLRNDLLSQLTIISKGSNICRKMLLNGDLDIAVVGSIQKIEDKELITENFAQSPLRIIVGNQHPWYQRKKVTLAELKNQKFIAQNESYIHNEALKQMGHLGHFRPEIIVQTDNINILKKLVSENLGIGLLTEIAVTKADNQLHMIEVDAENFPVFNMAIAYRRNHQLTEPQEELLEILKNSFE